MKLLSAKPSWKLSLIVYPFAATAVAINLFLLFLLLQAVGIENLSPVASVVAAIPLGIPATWLSARWIQSLIDEAEGRG